MDFYDFALFYGFLACYNLFNISNFAVSHDFAVFYEPKSFYDFVNPLNFLDFRDFIKEKNF
ncbi:MAG: hypothetical protein E6214_03025 [Peptoniphilus harei]|nr:hypothetical protein [Peptoniphilus harei]